MQLTKNITVLGDRHFRIYLLGSDPALLLEGGVSYIVPMVKKQVETIKNLNVKNIVLMHAHFDHVCGVKGLKKIFKHALTAGSAEAKKTLSRPKIIANFYKEDISLYETLGLKRNMASNHSEIIEIDQIIEDGAHWKLNEISVEFSLVPGHSHCSLIAYFPEEGVLFSSDSAGFPINDKKLFPIFFTGFKDYLSTIEKMKKLPVKILAGAHEQIIHGEKQVKGFLDLAANEAEKLMSFVLKAWRRGEDQNAIAAALYNEYYTGQLRIYTKQNIVMCCKLLTVRALQAAGVQLY